MIFDDDDQHLSYLDLPQQQSAEVEPGRGFAEVPPLQGEAATIFYLQVVFIPFYRLFLYFFLGCFYTFFRLFLYFFIGCFYTFSFKILWILELFTGTCTFPCWKTATIPCNFLYFCIQDYLELFQI